MITTVKKSMTTSNSKPNDHDVEMCLKFCRPLFKIVKTKCEKI
jgi:hypothetical protein